MGNRTRRGQLPGIRPHGAAAGARSASPHCSVFPREATAQPAGAGTLRRRADGRRGITPEVRAAMAALDVARAGRAAREVPVVGNPTLGVMMLPGYPDFGVYTMTASLASPSTCRGAGAATAPRPITASPPPKHDWKRRGPWPRPKRVRPTSTSSPPRPRWTFSAPASKPHSPSKGVCAPAPMRAPAPRSCGPRRARARRGRGRPRRGPPSADRSRRGAAQGARPRGRPIR